MIHIGMHPDDDVWFLEKRARKGKYEYAGDDGQMLSRDALKGFPEKLCVDFDVEDIAARVRKLVSVSQLSMNGILPTDVEAPTRTIPSSRHQMTLDCTSASCYLFYRSLFWILGKKSDASCFFMSLSKIPRRVSKKVSTLRLL